jgi:hypothetical protein
MGSAVAFPSVRNSDAAEEPQSSVDDQDLSMGPVVNAREMDEAENFHGDAGTFHQLDSASVHRVATERVLKKVHLHTGTRAFRQRLGEGVRDFAFLEKEIFKRDRTLRRTDAAQHCRKNLIAIFQRRDFVPFY